MPRFVLIFVLSLPCVLAWPAVAGAQQPTESVKGQVVYQSKFNDGIDQHWTTDKLSPAADGKPAHLGVFNQEKLQFKSDKLRPHKYVRVDLNLLLMGRWDGTNPHNGPDILAIKTGQGQVIMRSTFSTQSGLGQSFPDDVLTANYRGVDPRMENGRIINKPNPHLAHQLSFVFPHSDENLALKFLPITREQHVNASSMDHWGVAKVSVTTYTDTPYQLNEAQLITLLGLLRDSEPEESFNAIQTLIGAGDAAVALLASQPPFARTEGGAARVQALIAQLDDDDGASRQAAIAELKTLGATATPAMQQVLEGAVSLRQWDGIDQILRSMQHAHAYRYENRLARVLRLIDTEASRKLLKRVPNVSDEETRRVPLIPALGQRSDMIMSTIDRWANAGRPFEVKLTMRDAAGKTMGAAPARIKWFGGEMDLKTNEHGYTTFNLTTERARGALLEIPIGAFCDISNPYGTQKIPQGIEPEDPAKPAEKHDDD